MATDTLKSRIQEDMKAAMRAQDKQRLGTIRLIMAAIKQREVDERIMLDDAQVIAAIDKMIKQRRESITQFQAAGRDDLVAKEQQELTVLQTYMPAQLSTAEIEQIIAEAIVSSGAQGPQDMGKVMGIVKGRAQGRADMSQLSQLIKNKLAAL
ncbi:MAG: GatB/YqeY domain-containing protein [Gammaproteobacteria bacterium]|nr:GatB/YqeY domain-containing protein [Gammaproteobacteria bacterium]